MKHEDEGREIGWWDTAAKVGVSKGKWVKQPPHKERDRLAVKVSGWELVVIAYGVVVFFALLFLGIAGVTSG